MGLMPVPENCCGGHGIALPWQGWGSAAAMPWHSPCQSLDSDIIKLTRLTCLGSPPCQTVPTNQFNLYAGKEFKLVFSILFPKILGLPGACDVFWGGG